MKFRTTLLLPVIGLLSGVFNASTAPAADAPATQAGETRLLDRAHAAGFTLAKSFESYKSAQSPYDADGNPTFEPATISLTRTPDTESVYKTAFFFGWQPVEPPTWEDPFGGEWTPLFSVEGDLASDDNTATDALRLRATGHATYAPSTFQKGNIRGARFDASLKYEASREFDTEKLILEIQGRPTYTALGIGQRRNFGNKNQLGYDGHLDKNLIAPVQYMWEPWAGLDVGRTLDQPSVTSANSEQEDTVLRVTLAMDARLYLNFLNQPLGLEETYFSMTDKFYYLPLEDKEVRNFLSAGVHFLLNKNASIDVTYDIGRDAPKFEKVEVLAISLGLRF
jgi:hypothetical protein